MKTYVVGFPFNHGMSQLLLIEKKRPDWQAGKLNGIGGKIETGELALSAMVRECQEEAGLDIEPKLWRAACVLTDARLAWRVHFFYCSTDRIYSYDTKTDEEIKLFHYLDALTHPDLMPNLRIFIPLARDNSGIVKPLLIDDNTGSDKTRRDRAVRQ